MKVVKVDSLSLFQTESFRESTWVRELCARVGNVWIWENPPFETFPEVWSHFGTFFGAITRKPYDNPYMNDLYYLHELTHIDTLIYDPGQTFVNWKRGFISSELMASITSECLAYFHIPGLRSKVFMDHEIWVDRFLSNRAFMAIHPRAIEPYISEARLRAVNSPRFDDHYEMQLDAYFRQNHAWCELWSEEIEKEVPAFRAVLAHMSSPDRDATHVAWLEANAFGTGVPFHGLAKAFRPIFLETSKHYGNDLLRR